jgi:hypothetical protein
MADQIIDVEIEPRTSALSSLGASLQDFAAALDAALTRLAATPQHQLPSPGEIRIHLAGKEQPLGELAAIRVRLA